MKALFQSPALYTLLIFAACSGNNPTRHYTIMFDTNGGCDLAAVMVEQDKVLAPPKNPQKKSGVFNLDFEGWYTDAQLINRFSFAVPITVDDTLYAKYRNDYLLIITPEQLQAMGHAENLGGAH